MQRPMPVGLEEVDPRARCFPASWRDAAIRILFDDVKGGVCCAACKTFFRGRRELRTLHADHIRPWSRDGPTTWANLQLLCGPCNLSKNNRDES